MSNISGFGGLFGTSNQNSIWGGNNASSGSTILSDYAAIRNGSYKKLARKYYKADSVKTETEAKAENKKLGLIQTGADSLFSSLSALGKESLYAMKKISTKDETTGENKEKEDYDWKAITSAVKSFIDNYFEAYPGIKEYMEKTKKEAINNGYVKTMMGRIRNIPELKNKNYMIRQSGERIALNTPIQGTSADIIKKAMVDIYKEFKKNNIKSKMIIQVHDELVFDTLKE